MIIARGSAAVLLLALTLAACSTSTKGTGSRAATTAASSSASSGTVAAPTSSSSVPSTSAAPTPSTSTATKALRTETITSDDGLSTYPVTVWVEDTTVNCEGHAYGATVIAYLKTHLCRSMTRLLASTTVNGRAVGIAQTLISFSGTAPDVYQTAVDFKTLVEQNGTGNIADLLREGKRFPNSGTKVGDPDAFSASAQDAGAGIEDVWYLNGSTPENDPPLLLLAQSLFLQLT